MNASYTRGFTQVELAVTILMLGPVFAFSIPAFQSVSSSYQLKGATGNITAQRRLAREKAIATGMDQPTRFTYNHMSSDYSIHDGVKPALPSPPYLMDLAAGVKIGAGTGALVVFIR